MRVLLASCGGLGKCFVDSVLRRGEREDTFVFPLNVTSARRWFTLRRAAKARDAPTALSIGAPRMLLLASIARTVPELTPPASPRGLTERPMTPRPFSVTLTAEVVEALAGGQREEIRALGERRRPGFGQAAAARAVAVAATTDAKKTSAPARAIPSRFLKLEVLPGRREVWIKRRRRG